MRHIYNDGGRAAAGFLGNAGDCVVRAVAIATEQPYQSVYDALSEGCRDQRMGKRKTRKSSARNGVNTSRQWFKDYMKGLGWRWTPTMGIGTGCKVHLTDGELPMGRLIVAVSRHYTTVIDGVIHDTYSPERNVHVVMQGPQTNRPLKPGETRNENGICSVQRRCVYGYWQRQEAVS